MDFTLNEEQEMIRDVVHTFVENEIHPRAGDLDRRGEFPLALLGEMGDMGMLGMLVPEEFGGAGSDTLTQAIVVEELAGSFASLSLIVAVHAWLGIYPILRFGTPAQKARFLPKMATGEHLGAMAMTEPAAGSDPLAITTTAVRSGDHYLLNGTKIFISNGSRSAHPIVIAATDKSHGARSLSAFIVERGTSGFSTGTREEKLGMHCADTAELIFQDCAVPLENLLGTEGDGLKIALSALDHGRIGIGAQATGIATGALRASVTYARERKQFGKPIGAFQGVSFPMADMATRIDAARLLVYRAATLADTPGAHFGTQAAMAKLFASEVAMECTSRAIQIHGGYGYTLDYPVERYFRDAKVTEIYEGTSEIMRIVIARSLLGREFSS
ncbi:acyl-CoA dehydrogenase family protein [Myxococcota bacterium]|nr:acyl-CoA dehydrogenase family protein [Myxococcota bacterium]